MHLRLGPLRSLGLQGSQRDRLHRPPHPRRERPKAWQKELRRESFWQMTFAKDGLSLAGDGKRWASGLWVTR